MEEDDVEDAGQRRARAVAGWKARTGIDEPMIERLVHTFYGRVRTHPVLGPIFEARVEDWDRHLTRLCAFWSSVVLASGAYRGSPVARHLPLPIDSRHFDLWLGLFCDTAREVCPPAAADHFIERAQRIAESLELSIAVDRGKMLAPGERFLRPDMDLSAPKPDTEE